LPKELKWPRFRSHSDLIVVVVVVVAAVLDDHDLLVMPMHITVMVTIAAD
jgi:hypothetical protein